MGSANNNEDSDTLVSALHAAFHNSGALPHASSSSAPATHVHPPAADATMYPNDKTQTHMSLDIALAADPVVLKGTGVDVEPAVLAGNVVLFLTEATSIKEINLQFRGKARLPVNPNDPPILSHSPTMYGVCQHDWSFLEGGKKHSHTLKPGRHFFPFQLSIGGSLPSTIDPYATGGASVLYKLRATAVRPGFATNLSATCPVTILRCFTPAALEYQQTLEIENTWPGKLMYSLVVPHKAWAAGDEVTTLVKFSPVAKGVRVLTVTTTLNETTKVYTKTGGHSESTRVCVKAKHDIVRGHAVPADDHATPAHATPQSRHSPPSSAPSTPFQSFMRHSLPTLSLGSVAGSTAGPSQPRPSSPRLQSSDSEPDLSDSEVSTQIVIELPTSLTPSHALDPVIISYRIRWSIIITNADGHTSELRCSLPLHILDSQLIHEARTATAATRRLLLGGPDTTAEEAESDLPSYPSHVRDRVANVFMPDAATVRLSNPWVLNHLDPVSGHSSTAIPPPEMFYPHTSPHYVPASPDTGSGTSTPLDWGNSELFISLSDAIPMSSSAPLTRSSTPTPPESAAGSRRHSRLPSRTGSRVQSRAASPERGVEATHVHAAAPAGRARPGLFQMSMKPLSSLPHPWAHSHHTNSAGGAGGAAAADPVARAGTLPLPTPVSTTADPTGAALLHRAFTEVPTYGVASRGFLGGGAPPLDSMRGLPSYDEVRSSLTTAAQPEDAAIPPQP